MNISGDALNLTGLNRQDKPLRDDLLAGLHMKSIDSFVSIKSINLFY